MSPSGSAGSSGDGCYILYSVGLLFYMVHVTVQAQTCSLYRSVLYAVMCELVLVE